MILDLGRPPKAPRADYEYTIARNGPAPVLQIIDLDEGNMSVTNDLPAVLLAIWREISTHTNLLELVITYRDSQGDWDFIELKPIDGRKAFNIIIEPGSKQSGLGII